MERDRCGVREIDGMFARARPRMPDSPPSPHDQTTGETTAGPAGDDRSPEVAEALETLLALAATLEQLDLEGVAPAFLR
jgi:hypothetical protein